MDTYLLASVATLAVEVPLYVLVLTGLTGTGPVRAAGWALLVNAVTHPLLWWLLHPAATRAWGDAAGTAAVEVWAWLVEALLLVALLRGERVVAFAGALLANACSYLLGVAVIP